MNSLSAQQNKSADALFKQIKFIFILIAIILLINIPVFVQNISSLHRTESDIRTHFEFIRKIESVVALIRDAQAGERGYILTNKDRYLLPYTKAIKQLKINLNSILAENHVKNPDDEFQKRDTRLLYDYATAKIDEMQSTIALYKKKGFTAAQNTFLSPEQKVKGSAIQFLAKKIIDVEYVHLNKDTDLEQQKRKFLILSLYSAFFLDAIFMYFAYCFFEKELRKRSQLAKSLDESEAEFRMLAETIPQIVWTVNPDGTLDYSNKRWTEVTGFSKDEATSWGWLDTVHPDDVDRVKTTRMHSKQAGQEYESEFRMRTKDGSYRWQVCRAVPMKDKHGNIKKWFGTTYDIHDYKKALDEARASENKIRKIVDSNIIGMVFFSLDGRVTDCNDNFLKTLGFSRDEVLNEKNAWQKFIAPEYHFDTSIAMKKLKNKEVIQPCEKEFIRKDGTKIPVMLGAVHQDLDNNSGMAFVLDMTERKKALEAIENANNAKSRFLAMMSHEMRTPLGVILGFTDLALDPLQSASERHNAILRIKKNAELLTELVNDILDLSKIEANKIEFELKITETTPFIKELSESMFIKAKEKGLNLIVNTEGTLPKYIETDPFRLKQILYNIIGNAIKFTSHGEVSLTIKAQETSDPNKQKIIFLVQDTGIGISDDQSERLFKPFSQADGSTTRKYGGTGLGLVLSQKLASALGGDVRLASSGINRGSVFEVSIESIKVNIDQLVVPIKTNMVAVNTSLNGMNVLIVEDSLDIQVLVTKYLKFADANIDLADNGKVGVQKALEKDYDIILMDISMPELDGFQATMQLRKAGYKKPIIAMSAHAMVEERDLAIKVGFDDYITKPMSRATLIEKLSAYMKSAPQKRLRLAKATPDDDHLTH